MARTTATNFSGGLQFPYATAATDIFHKEDIQTLAVAVDQHDHTAGKGVAVNTTPADGSITLAKLAPNSVDSSKIVDATIVAADMAPGAALNNLLPRSISQVVAAPFGAGISTTSTTLVGTTDVVTMNATDELILFIAMMPVTIPANATVTASAREVASGSLMPYPVIVANGTASARVETLTVLWVYQAPGGATVTRSFETMWATSAGTVVQAGVRYTSLLVHRR